MSRAWDAVLIMVGAFAGLVVGDMFFSIRRTCAGPHGGALVGAALAVAYLLTRKLKET